MVVKSRSSPNQNKSTRSQNSSKFCPKTEETFHLKNRRTFGHRSSRNNISLYDHMDLTSTNIDELVGFQNNLSSTEKHFGRFDLLQIFQIVDPERDIDGSILPTIKAGK
jgi:hypothetical protein